MKFLAFLLKNLLRNRVRSLLTGLSIAMAVFILCVILTMGAVMRSLTAGKGGAENHVVIQEKYSFPSLMPLGYLDKVRALPEVQTACPYTWWGAKGKTDSDPPIFGPAVEASTIEPFLDNLFGHAQRPEQLEAFKRDKQAILVGIKWHENYGWTIGDTITLQGVTLPVRLEFHVAGYIVEGALDDNYIFRHDYLQDTLEAKSRESGREADAARTFNGQIFAIYIDPRPGVAPAALIEKLEREFAGGPVFIRAESEASVLASFAASAGVMIAVLSIFGLAAALTLFLVVANAISMSIRERTLEIGVLKTLGFTRPGILALVLGESGIVALLAGGAGAGIAWGATQLVPLNFSLGIISRFVVSGPVALLSVVIALFIGLASGLWPAWRAARLSIVDVLRRLN
jgi:putative ABC transport system permease protein